MEGFLLVLVVGWLVWKYYMAVVAKPPKESRGDEKAAYDRYEDHLDGFPYRREEDGSVSVLTATGEVHYRSVEAFYAAIRPDYQREEEARQLQLQQQQAEQWRAAEQLRQEQLEQEREAERLHRQQREQEQEVGKPHQPGRESASASEKNEEWWTVLEVPPHADADTIQSAYRQKIKQCHPDRVAGLAPEFGELAERQAKRLNAAYRKAIQARRAS